MSEPLVYVRAQDVERGMAAFGVQVCGEDGEPLGRLEGFLIDQEHQALRYFVVDSREPLSLERRLIPFVPAQLDLEHHVLRLMDRPRPRSAA